MLLLFYTQSADDTPLPWRVPTIAILRACVTLHMPTKSSKPKWADAQFVLDADGLPLPRGTRANDLLSTEQAGRKRGRSTESVLGGPELCGPVEDLSGVAFTASDEARGGPAAPVRESVVPRGPGTPRYANFQAAQMPAKVLAGSVPTRVLATFERTWNSCLTRIGTHPDTGVSGSAH